MSRTSTFLKIASGALAALALTASGIAIGQTNSAEHEVKIDASKVVVMRHGHPRRGIHNETVHLSAQVNFADLDLATESGTAALRQRIETTASEICRQLGVLYFPGSVHQEHMDRQECVKRAVDDAMEQAKPAIAAARNSHHE